MLKRDKKIEVIPYLSFNGNCEEALKTYIEAFGGEIYGMSRWSEDTFKVTPEQIGKVMHVEFSLGNTRMAEGGTVLSPLKPHPKPDDGGCGSAIKDRFGYTWFITCPNPAKQQDINFCPVHDDIRYSQVNLLIEEKDVLEQELQIGLDDAAIETAAICQQ